MSRILRFLRNRRAHRELDQQRRLIEELARKRAGLENRQLAEREDLNTEHSGAHHAVDSKQSLIKYYQSFEASESLRRGVARYIESDEMLATSHLHHYAVSSLYRHLDQASDWRSVGSDLKNALMRAAVEVNDNRTKKSEAVISGAHE